MDASGYALEIDGSHKFDPVGEKAIKSKMPRQRKREFYNTIRKQMEFYFGDANLSKDRFLMKLIKEDKHVPLEVFLKFNKIKKLVTSAEEIAKALEHSDQLQLTVDKSKVSRITEIPDNWDAENRTIYVESLPPTADHDWVRNLFSRFGPVAYVSLPKFKISKKIKEFGFIEFECEESAQRAVNTFKSLGSIISSDSSNPENLFSIRTFLKEQSEDNKNLTDCRKRQHSPDWGENENDGKRKKIDLEDDTTDSDDDKDDKNDETILEDGHKKKKRRRKKKKNQKKSIDFDLSELKVLPKVEWKKLRNKYLNMQRKKVSEMKQEIRKKSDDKKLFTGPKPRETSEKRVEVKKLQSMNFYGAGQDNEDDVKTPDDDEKINIKMTSPALERKPLFKYEPDLVVKIKMYAPCVDIKSFKADMRQYPGVLYVDVSEGSFEAFIRCETSKYAKNLKKRVSCAEYLCEILSGDQEIEYWNKMMKDREMKLNKMVKAPYKRGKQKLAVATAKHILFNEDE